MVYGIYNELLTGAYKATYNWGASHCLYITYSYKVVPPSFLLSFFSIQSTMWGPQTIAKLLQTPISP